MQTRRRELTPEQQEIEKYLRKAGQENFRVENIVVELKHFGDWGQKNQLIKVVKVLGTTTYSDIIDIKKEGVEISRVKDGCFDSTVLGRYELSWEKIKELIATQKGVFRDGSVVIAKRELYRLLELQGKHGDLENVLAESAPNERNIAEILRDPPCPKCSNTLVYAEGSNICIECGYHEDAKEGQ